jgi:hypothetical protein
MSHFRNTGGQNPDSQKELAASRELFRKAQENLQRAYDRNQSNREVEELLTRNNMFLYDCMKRTTLK